MRISDWSSDVCSSDLKPRPLRRGAIEILPAPAGTDSPCRVQGTCTHAPSPPGQRRRRGGFAVGVETGRGYCRARIEEQPRRSAPGLRSEEHTSELQSLMRNSYAVFCLKKKLKT